MCLISDFLKCYRIGSPHTNCKDTDLRFPPEFDTLRVELRNQIHTLRCQSGEMKIAHFPVVLGFKPTLKLHEAPLRHYGVTSGTMALQILQYPIPITHIQEVVVLVK